MQTPFSFSQEEDCILQQHLQKLKDLGVSPDDEDIKIRMAVMQSQMEFSAGIMNILSASYGGVQIILPQNFNLLNPENPTNEKEWNS